MCSTLTVIFLFILLRLFPDPVLYILDEFKIPLLRPRELINSSGGNMLYHRGRSRYS